MSYVGTFTPRTAISRFRPEPGTLDGLFATQKSDTSYDVKWAYALSVVSAWTYSDGQVLADKLQYYGFPSNVVHHLSVRNDALCVVATAYFIQSEDRRVGILAFRGTEPLSLINWLTNADTTKYRLGSGYVHSGFFANIEAVWGDVVGIVDGALADAARPLEHLYLTGHSLGGAMAVVAAARIFENPASSSYSKWRDRLRGIYTFAQPMVGDGAFRDEFAGRFGGFLYRHIFDSDVVPCLPPAFVDRTFVHFGPKRVAPTVEARWQESSAPERRAHLLDLLRLIESFVTRRVDGFQGIKVPYSLEDHSPKPYVEVSRNSAVPAGDTTIARLGDRPSGALFLLRHFLAKAATLRSWPAWGQPSTGNGHSARAPVGAPPGFSADDR